MPRQTLTLFARNSGQRLLRWGGLGRMATVRACLDGSHTWTEAEHTLVFCINSSSLSFHPTVSLAAPIHLPSILSPDATHLSSSSPCPTLGLRLSWTFPVLLLTHSRYQSAADPNVPATVRSSRTLRQPRLALLECFATLVPRRKPHSRSITLFLRETPSSSPQSSSPPLLSLWASTSSPLRSGTDTTEE